MFLRTYALIFGVVFLVAGASGFVPALSPVHEHSGLLVTAESRLAMGLFPVNVLHNLVHLAFGLWGVLAARSATQVVIYARSVAIIYGTLTVLGLIPATDTTFGFVPIYGNDVWLHASLAVVSAYFGFVHRMPAGVQRPA